MKKLCLVLVAIFFEGIAFSQVSLNYRICAGGNCGTNYTTSNFDAEDISSDFGRREADWHRGVDFVVRDGSNAGYGYPILSPVDGTITRIDVLGQNQFTIVTIQDGNQINPTHFAYAHVFTPGNIPIVVGDFVLFGFTHQSNTEYAIINTQNQTALSDIDGVNISYNNTAYVTTNEISAGDPIAPLGNSGDYPIHLHLYSVLNPFEDPRGIDNAHDPLQKLNIDGAEYTFNLGNNGGDINNLTLFSGINQAVAYYNGNQSGSFKIDCLMDNCNPM